MFEEKLPGCCCGKVIFALDEEYDRQHSEYPETRTSKKTIKEELIQKIKASAGLCSFIIITTNSNQTVSEEVLKELEFKMCGKSPSTNHPPLTVTVWYKAFLELNND